MSLSNPRQVNPASKFIEWSGSIGQFYYYDKSSEADDKNVFIKEPIYVVPIDQLATIKGFHKQSKSGVYSNEVKNTLKDKLIVRSFKGGSIITGLYSEIKGNLEGGKYAKSMYAVMITGDKNNSQLELVNISFYGSSLGSFIDAKINIDSGCILSLEPSTEELINGATTYFAPKIIKYKMRRDILDRCIEIDEQLQAYLKEYLNKPIDEETDTPDKISITENEYKVEDTEGGSFDEDDDLPF